MKKLIEPERDTSPLSEEFQRLREMCSTEQITLGELMVELERRGPALVSLLLACPFLLPTPPGVAIPFGIAITLTGVSFSIGRPTWIPVRLRERKLPTLVFAHVFRWANKAARAIEPLLRPRLLSFVTVGWLLACHGAIIAISGMLLSLPLPPGTNFAPAATAVLISLGMLERDGVVIILGYVAFLLTIVQFGALGLLGAKGIEALL